VFKEDGLFAPTHIGTDKAAPFPKTIQTMKNEAILWIKKGLGFKGKWTINEQINLIQNLCGLNNTIPV